MERNRVELARVALACLDLTSLNDTDTEVQVADLCERAAGPHGPVAALCVWPRLARFARDNAAATIAVAAVANFPDGSTDIERAVRDTGEIVQAGAQEVDVVLPYRALLAGDAKACTALLHAVRRASEGLKLKVILETGELREPTLMRRAALIALDAGADFLKTSTGKTPVSATPHAAETLLRTIRDDSRPGSLIGFKASGGVRTVAEAAVYIGLVESVLGASALAPARFRIGASSLLGDIEAVLSGTAPTVEAATGY